MDKPETVYSFRPKGYTYENKQEYEIPIFYTYDEAYQTLVKNVNPSYLDKCEIVRLEITPV